MFRRGFELATDLPAHLTALVDVREKSIEDETRLAQINALLSPIESQLRAKASKPQFPICFVVGPPRSGSTLASQLLAVTGVFQASNNFIARFWQAPALATLMARVLPLPPLDRSFMSERGRTSGLSAPHEFGYFWSHWFDLGQSTHTLNAGERARVDGEGLVRALGAMEAAAARPLLFKNNTWCTAQADFLAGLLPTARFVVCDRDPFFIAQSILEQRRRLGDEAAWWSMRPAGSDRWGKLDPLEEVARQTVGIYRDMETALAHIPVDRVCRVNYQTLCSDPQRTVSGIVEWLGMELHAGLTEALPRRLDATDTVKLDPERATALRNLLLAL